MDSLNRIAQTSESNARLAVRKPPSLDYVEWLIVSITNLAIYLRDTNALDAEGMVVQKMAEDLAHTGRFEMVDVFMLARRRFKFLPRTMELLDLYAEVRKSHTDQEERQRHKAALDEQAALAEDRRLHPEKYISFGEIVREAGTPKIKDHVAQLEGRAAAAQARRLAEDNAPKVSECPHCGKPIPQRVADLRGLSIEQLEGLVEGKKLYAAQQAADRAAAKESLRQAIQAAEEQAPTTAQPRTKKGTR